MTAATSLLDALASGGPEAFQQPTERRRELARDLVAASYLRGSYVLTSGQPSDFYLDSYLFASKPTVLRRLAGLLAERLPAGTDRIAGAELGAVPLATALSLQTGVPFVIVRRPRGSYAPAAGVEGELHAGERVVLVEDVVTTASRALDAAREVMRTGAEISAVLAVVDREEGGAAAATAAGLPFEPLFRLSELPVPTAGFGPAAGASAGAPTGADGPPNGSGPQTAEAGGEAAAGPGPGAEAAADAGTAAGRTTDRTEKETP